MADHIEQIKNGTKIQTRRLSSSYLVGKTYSIQPGRRERGIPEGRILITQKRREKYLAGFISPSDALAEGGYTSGQFETLFMGVYPNWTTRYAYTFEFVPSSSRMENKDE